LSAILVLVLGLNYISYKNQYEKDRKNFINSEVRLHKKAILNSIQNRNSDFEGKKELFFNISKNALDLLKKDKNLNLSALKSVLKTKYDLKGFDFEIYLIDNFYKIYKTTYNKDLNLDLKNISNAKNLLDKSLDGNIHFSKFINSDPVSLEYRLYSYSSISENDFLELSFINTEISNTSMSSLIQNLQSNSSVKVYRVFKNKEGFSYYDLLKRLESESKEQFYKSLNVVEREYISQNDIMNSAINFIQTEELNENILTITTPIFDKNMFEVLGFENVVIELKIDLSEKIEFMNEMENLFIGSLIVIFFLLLLIFIFIQNRFTIPIESILKSIKDSKKVDEELLLYNNELSKIAKKYNILYDNFKNELELNSNLLDENMRFIADTVHQIRTPLTNIMMNGEMIKKFQKDKAMDTFIEQIDASISMLSNSYEDLAYITTSDTIEYSPTKVNISLMLKNRIKFFSTISKVNRKEIKSNIEEDVFIYINQIELERIIDNNISNGIKYATKDEFITINLFKNTDTVILEFKTFGNPIQNNHKVFEKNYRENKAKRGLGLGLNMVKNICDKYKITYDVTYIDNQNIFTYTFLFSK